MARGSLEIPRVRKGAAEDLRISCRVASGENSKGRPQG